MHVSALNMPVQSMRIRRRRFTKTQIEIQNGFKLAITCQANL